MGFHLVDKVYFNVTGTSPTAQAVLAYLAHRADDKGVRKCYPAVESIKAATHFGHTSIHNALNELREANLLTWKSGGRHKGEGGRALANEYELSLPAKPPASIIRQADNAVSAKRTMHTPPGGQCIVRQTDTITQDHPKSQSSVITETEAHTEDLKKGFEDVASAWERTKEAARERLDIKERTHRGVQEEAMEAAGVSDFENKKIFASTLLRRDPQQCLEVIWEFASQRRAHEHDHLKNPAAALNSLLAALPVIN